TENFTVLMARSWSLSVGSVAVHLQLTDSRRPARRRLSLSTVLRRGAPGTTRRLSGAWARDATESGASTPPQRGGSSMSCRCGCRHQRTVSPPQHPESDRLACWSCTSREITQVSEAGAPLQRLTRPIPSTSEHATAAQGWSRAQKPPRL